MGCDIHQKLYVWSKIENKYVDSHEVSEYSRYFFDNLILGRWYMAFGVLAGVRSDYMTIENERHSGIPECASPTFIQYLHEGYYHSFTWYYLDELKKNLKQTADKIYKDIKNSKDNEEEKRLAEWCKKKVIDIDKFYAENDGYFIDRLFDISRTIVFFYFDS